MASLTLLDSLIGLRLSIVRRAADMLVLHFGNIEIYKGGTIGEYAFHIQCPWRLDGPDRIITGRIDYYEYDGPGEEPDRDWHDEHLSLQDTKFMQSFGPMRKRVGWMISHPEHFVVTSVQSTEFGDVTIHLTGGYKVSVFPASSKSEAWRFFAPAKDGEHTVFPA